MSSPPPASPPAGLEKVVERWLGDAPSTRFVIGDLREDYAALAARRAVWVCVLWYVIEGLRVGARARAEALRRTRGRHGDAERDGPPPAVRRTPTRTRPVLRGDLMRTDLRQAARFLRRRPAFSATIVLTVALAISTTTVAFAVLDGILLEPLPYGEPERVVAVWENNSSGNPRNVVSPVNFHTWREELTSFDALAALLETSTTYVSGDEPERVGLVFASAAYFDVVGARPLAGRFYTEEEDAPGAERVALISESYWVRRFDRDPSVIGATLQVGGFPHTVVGVLPERFDARLEWSFGGIGTHDFWLPHRMSPEARESTGRSYTVVGRLARGASVEGARQEATALAERLAAELPDRQQGWSVTIAPLRADLVGGARSTILVVFGAVCFVLLIACSNVANLLMTRATVRQQEMAVRSAMGAAWSRIVQQLLLESALLSAVGGALGLALAAWGVDALVRVAPDLPRIEDVGLDATVVGFALLATVGTALLFGLTPALPVSGASLAGWLRDRGTRTRRRTQRVRGMLAVAQSALSLMLLVGAGLLGRSLLKRLEVGVGFDVGSLLTAEVRSAAPTEEERSLFFERLVERVRAVPGVEAASAITWLPLAGGGTRTGFWRADRPPPGPGERSSADVRWVHRGYHALMGIPLARGRTFADGDDSESPMVVVVNETGAREIWPGEDPVGKRIAMPWGDTILAEVVGVVGDVRHDGPDTELFPMFYFEHRQFAAFPQMSLVVRTGEGADAGPVLTGVRAALRELDPRLPLYNVRTMESLFSDAITRERFATVAMGAFALLALLLAAIGIYGVMAHVTEQRVREIGIRMALGAGRASVLGMVVRQGMAHVALAIAVGAAGALALSRVLQGMVYDVSTTDPLTFAATAAVLAATGLVACWLPARRASAVDPAETIRSE